MAATNIPPATAADPIPIKNKTMANLPLGLKEEILSRFPIFSLKSMKLTCKEWNAISKNRIFQRKHCGKAGKEMMAIKVDIFKLRLRLMSFNLQKYWVDPSIHHTGKLNGLTRMSTVFHCDGLILCIFKSDRLIVWNPYLCKFRSVQSTRLCQNNGPITIIGYDNNKHHKILRICCWLRPYKYEIYNFKSDSWSKRDFNQCIEDCGVSFKGNNYFIDSDNCLVCFDFTKERFEQRLPLPYDSSPGEHVVLSVVKEEQLAVLRFGLFETQIWITTKIELTAVLWRSFINLNMTMKRFASITMNFYVEEKKKIAVICYAELNNHKACVIEEDRYFVEGFDLGKFSHKLVMCSYVPSLMWIL